MTSPPTNPDFPFREEFAVAKLKPALANAAWLVTSPFVPNAVLVGIHFILAAFGVVIMILSGINEGGPKWFVFLTNWGYTHIVLSFIGFTALGIWQLRLRKSLISQKQSAVEVDMALAEWHWYHSMLQVIYTNALDLSIMITILYWTLLKPKGTFLDICVHALNAVMTLLQLFLCNVKLNLLHFVYPMTCAAVYLIFSAVYTVLGGRNTEGEPFIYSTLDWNNKPTSAALLSAGACFLGVPAMHGLAYGIMRARVAIARRSYGPATASPESHAMDNVV
eukprot:scpid71128/ scgid35508/ Protein rolling stone